jgi:hypothetical protein
MRCSTTGIRFAAAALPIDLALAVIFDGIDLIKLAALDAASPMIPGVVNTFLTAGVLRRSVPILSGTLRER